LYRLLEQPAGMERLQLEGRFALPQSMIGQEANGTMLIIAKRGNRLRQILRRRGIRLRSAFLHGFAQEIKRKALRNLSRGSSFGTLSPCIRNQLPGCKHKHAGSGNEERTTVHIAPTF